MPLKFSMRSAELPRPPTAQTSVGEMAVTALSCALPVAGVVWTLQDVPLKCSTSGDSRTAAETLRLLPTAQTSLLDKALTPVNSATDAPAGGRGDHGPARPVEVLDQRRHVSVRVF